MFVLRYFVSKRLTPLDAVLLVIIGQILNAEPRSAAYWIIALAVGALISVIVELFVDINSDGDENP